MRTMNKVTLPIIILFLLALAVTAYASVAFSKPVGADIVFHLQIVDAYLNGQNGMFAPHVMEINRIPYPPLFHLLLLPSVSLGVSYAFIRTLQMLLYPTCLLLAMTIAKKYGQGTFHAVLVGLTLMGSMAYLDATFQVRPESLDILLWLILLYAALSFHGKLGTASAIAGVYNHSFPSLILNGGVLLYQRNWKRILVIAVASLPIIIISLYYASAMLGKWVGTPASPQAYAFLHNWLPFTFTYLGSLLIGFPIIAYQTIKWKTLNTLSKFCVATVFSSLLLLPVWYDRYYQYISVPLAILIGDFVATRKGKMWLAPKIYIVIYVVVLFTLGYMTLWTSNFGGFWDIH